MYRQVNSVQIVTFPTKFLIAATYVPTLNSPVRTVSSITQETEVENLIHVQVFEWLSCLITLFLSIEVLS